MVDSQDQNVVYNEEVESDEEMFPSGDGSQNQYELKDLDSQTMGLFDSQTYIDDANRVLMLGDFAGASQEINISSQGIDHIVLSEPIDLEDIPIQIDNHPSSSTLDHLKQFPSLDVMMQPWINFQVSLPSEASDKTSWMYSDMLKKLFVKMGNTCTFNVSLAASSNLTTTVRAMLVCSSPEDLHLPISRCDNHRCSDIQELTDDIKMHVVRCKNEQVAYVGTKDGKIFEERLAVLVPMGHTGKAGITLEFVCQNSCRNISRRATALVFTLEDQHGRILGRQLFQIKICTNIKRDKLNEENTGKEEASRKRKATAPSTAVDAKRGKRLMQRQFSSSSVQIKEEAGTRRCEIDPVVVQVTLPNRRMAKRMLESAIGLVSSAVLRSQGQANELMQYVHDIRRTKSSFGMPNSQSSVDSD